VNDLKFDFGDVEEEMFLNVESPFECIFAFWVLKKGFGVIRGSDVLLRRMTPKTNNMHS
jgi:hypothetical protein